MIFDVTVREGFNKKGKQIINISRIHDTGLSIYLRLVQDKGGYIINVTPLFRRKKETIEVIQQYKEDMASDIDPIDPDIMIDPHGY